MGAQYELLTEASRKARKKYRCILCGEGIEKGAKYVYTSGACEGTIQADRWHPECRAAVQGFSFEDWDYWSPGTYHRGTVEQR